MKRFFLWAFCVFMGVIWSSGISAKAYANSTPKVVTITATLDLDARFALGAKFTWRDSSVKRFYCGVKRLEFSIKLDESIRTAPFDTSPERQLLLALLQSPKMIVCASEDGTSSGRLQVDTSKTDQLYKSTKYFAPDPILSPELNWTGPGSLWNGYFSALLSNVSNCEITKPSGNKACSYQTSGGVVRVIPADAARTVQEVKLTMDKGATVTLRVAECKIDVQPFGPVAGVVAGATAQQVLLSAKPSSCPKSVDSFSVDGIRIRVEETPSGRFVLRGIPATLPTGNRSGKAFFGVTPIAEVNVVVVPPVTVAPGAWVYYNVRTTDDPHGLFAKAGGPAALSDPGVALSLPFAVVDPTTLTAEKNGDTSIFNTVTLKSESVAGATDPSFDRKPPAAACVGDERVRAFGWTLASHSWGEDARLEVCSAGSARCVLDQGLQRMKYRVNRARPDKWTATFQLVLQTHRAETVARRLAYEEALKLQNASAPDLAPPSKTQDQKSPKPDNKKNEDGEKNEVADADVSGGDNSQNSADGNKEETCHSEEPILELSVDLAAGARRESVPLPIRDALVVECDGAFEVKKGNVYTKWIGDGEMRSIQEEDVRNGLCRMRVRPACEPGQTPASHSCRVKTHADGLYGPQVLVLSVSRAGSQEAVAVYSLPAIDTPEATRARFVLPKPPDTNVDAGVYYVVAEIREQPRADVQYRSTLRERLIAATVTSENRDLKMMAQLRPRGTFGWSMQPFGQSFRSYVTLPVQVTGVRFPASPRDLRTSRDPLAYQLMTPKLGVMAVIEPWDYDSGENPTAANFGLSTGFHFFQIGEGTVATSYLLGIQATLPLIHSNNVPASRFSSQVGTALTTGLYWELDLRDGITRGNHVLFSVGLNVATVFSGN
ncbi:MAG: hypothetical protein IPK82_29870 [Polyangiaceae bacterium]|nr:hypothetical protein [Polyangiaceae bacterium]